MDSLSVTLFLEIFILSLFMVYQFKKSLIEKSEIQRQLYVVSKENQIAFMKGQEDEKKKIVAKDLIANFPNAIYLGTFSKAYALGGMRVGYGIAQPEIINTLYKLRAPFNITTLTLAAAIEAIKDEEFVNACIAKNFEEMSRYEDYATSRGFEYIPSYTNFITIKFGDKFVSKTVAQKLLEKGVIVRDLTGYGQNAIRITIGRNEQNTKVFEQLDEVLENLK
jgi:histidinol-phosphate aminotransferase